MKVKTFGGEQLIRWNGRKPSRASAAGLMAKSCAMRKHILCSAAMQERRGSLLPPNFRLECSCWSPVCVPGAMRRLPEKRDPGREALPRAARKICLHRRSSSSNNRVNHHRSIGFFDLEYFGHRLSCRYSTIRMRTGADNEIELRMTVTPLGAVSPPRHASRRSRGEGSACGRQRRGGGSASDRHRSQRRSQDHLNVGRLRSGR